MKRIIFLALVLAALVLPSGWKAHAQATALCDATCVSNCLTEAEAIFTLNVLLGVDGSVALGYAVTYYQGCVAAGGH